MLLFYPYLPILQHFTKVRNVSKLLNLSLSNGLYLVKITGDKNFACSKLMID